MSQDLTLEITYEEMESFLLVSTQLNIEMTVTQMEEMAEPTPAKLKTTGYAKMGMRPLHQSEMSEFLNIE